MIFGGLVTVETIGEQTVGADSYTPTWVHLMPASNPPPRGNGSMAYDPNTGQLVLFGGENEYGDRLDDTWTWDGSTWTDQSPSNVPNGVEPTSMAFDPATNQLLLFAYNADETGVDTWTWDGSNWDLASTSGPVVGYASMAYDASTAQMILFGGYPQFANQTYLWNGTNWVQLAPTTSPSPRAGVAMAYDAASAQLVLFGGVPSTQDPQTAFDDTWIWDGSNWEEQSPATVPPARSYPSIAYDPAISEVVMFGGQASSGFFDPLGDTWTWDGTNWTADNPTTVPSARVAASMAYDGSSSQLILFSAGDSSLNDTWMFDANPSDTVAFNSEGGSAVSSISGPDGSPITLPAVPTRAGYTFDGWFAAVTGGTALTSPFTVPVGGTTLYAQWTDNSNFVGIPANNATVSGTGVVLDAGASSGATKVQYEITGEGLTDDVIATAAPTLYGWIALWNSTNVPNGAYSLQVISSGPGAGTGAPITVTVNNLAPSTFVGIPANNATVSGTSVVFDAGAASGVTKVQFEITGEGLTDDVIATAGPTFYGWIALWNSTSVPAGAYTLQSVASYSGGVIGTSSGVTITT
jgi:uncharacterized repeat protein (TIGR02543 family)